MADYKILITDFIKTLQKLDEDNAPDEQIVEYVRRNSSRLIDEEDLDEMTAVNIKQAKDCIPNMVAVEVELDDDVYEKILKQIEGSDLTVERFVVHALNGYIARRGI